MAVPDVYKSIYFRDKVYNKLAVDSNIIARAVHLDKRSPNQPRTLFPALTVWPISSDVERVENGAESGTDAFIYPIQIIAWTRSMDDTASREEIMNLTDEILHALKFWRDGDFRRIPAISQPLYFFASAAGGFCYGSETVLTIEHYLSRT